MTNDSITEDRMLGGRILLRQPSDGLRAAIDPVFLAAAIPAKPGQRILDLGCGTGIVSLCLARRVPDCSVVGLDVQGDLVSLANENAALNELQSRVSAIHGDLVAPPPALLDPRGFDHVMANPPFMPAGKGTLPPIGGKALAVAEGEATLALWVERAFAMVRRRGAVTFIQRADRLAELVAAFSRWGGAITIFPLWPAAGKPASRVIVRARRDGATPLSLKAGMILHEEDGGYTAAAEQVLRQGAAVGI